MLKRSFDLVTSSLMLVASAPVLAAVYLAVRLTSRGPALFQQIRVGLGGGDFTVYKFRTMAVRQGSESGSFDAGDSSRVTRVGRWLRASKLDELPQLWNVVRGDMSLVGPRPEVRKWVDAYPERWAMIHTVRPGITDPAAIVYRHEETLLASSADPERTYRDEVLPHKLDLYENYVRTRTFSGDIWVLAKTVLVVLSPVSPPRATSGAADRPAGPT